MKYVTKKATILMLTLALILTMFMPATTYAASKKGITISCIKSGTTITIGTTASLKVKVNTKASISYKTSNKKIASVKNGKITTYKTGTVTIKMTAKPKSKKYKTTSKSIKIKVVNLTTPKLDSLQSKTTAIITANTVKNANAYQFQYATNSKLSGATSKTVKKPTLTINNTKSKKYYVKCRAIRKVGKKTYYSKWSKTIVVNTSDSNTSTSTPSDENVNSKLLETPELRCYTHYNLPNAQIYTYDIENATAYEFQYSLNKDMSKATTYIGNSQGTVIHITTDKTTVFYARCRAMKKANSETEYSKWSDIKTVTIEMCVHNLKTVTETEQVTIPAHNETIVDKPAWDEYVGSIWITPEKNSYFDEKVPYRILITDNRPEVIKAIQDKSTTNITIDYLPEYKTLFNNDIDDENGWDWYRTYADNLYKPSDFGKTYADFNLIEGDRMYIFRNIIPSHIKIQHPAITHQEWIPEKTETRVTSTYQLCSKCGERKYIYNK